MARWRGFEPVLVPEPAHPDRWYEGSVPAAVPVVVRERRPTVPQARESVPPEVVEEPVRPVPVRTAEEECPGEWVDTWLWEVCLDRKQELAAQESWLPGI
ncbi:hypothetical protein E1286_44315 [Nonomuraea terrae]|uniref:Uncharacterized protein n=1 Tax=Nonomuraea terrae TaxID=2530383 RepID=A0A4R4XMP7_9ACTN|nr:hypothetical protein [Nonomuraea terrae]TDD31852.1 hypothetical protein E1286_44315 [Nonomuraea terrae]